uniref:Uncharacterized protein n=1 Tax=Anopheles darlingi TaxID=43151 RepID=A0A2M4DG98_ANODA
MARFNDIVRMVVFSLGCLVFGFVESVLAFASFYGDVFGSMFRVDSRLNFWVGCCTFFFCWIRFKFRVPLV